MNKPDFASLTKKVGSAKTPRKRIEVDGPDNSSLHLSKNSLFCMVAQPNAKTK